MLVRFGCGARCHPAPGCQPRSFRADYQSARRLATRPTLHPCDDTLINMRRRTILQMLPAVVAPQQLVKAADLCAANGGSRFENYSFAFFTADEAELAASLMEIIIPADQNSPGAKQARTAAFADLMLSTG